MGLLHGLLQRAHARKVLGHHDPFPPTYVGVSGRLHRYPDSPAGYTVIRTVPPLCVKSSRVVRLQGRSWRVWEVTCPKAGGRGLAGRAGVESRPLVSSWTRRLGLAVCVEE
ncbi:hypothetical protein BJY20_001092 [Janibacter cremeus]|uniref:Uncharacterized protein n=1 Tax=Janibacter cremeus TaxID=1285192 RepID=A0A852VQG7_9MICO|nr:hypothetical protein [Janibacter cremeus]